MIKKKKHACVLYSHEAIFVETVLCKIVFQPIISGRIDLGLNRKAQESFE